MQIVDKLLPKNDFSRTGKSLAVMDAVVIHNLGVPGQRALVAREYWAGLANQDAMDSKPDISASAHYIIDFDGVIYRTIPENERAYHVGSSVKDPSAETPPPLSQKLRDLATKLEQATTDSESDWETLSQDWINLSSRLQQLATLSVDSENEMKSIQASLKAYEKSLKASIVQTEREKRAKKLWRYIAIGASSLAVAGSAIDDRGVRGASVGVGLGAVVGVAVWAIEYWPPWTIKIKQQAI